VENTCEEKGITRLMLDVRESNESARAFYKSLGFEEDGIRKNFYEMPKENAVLMSKVLG
jgi:ribosomal-protein-alanine N-acetyltransferase